MQKQKNKNGFSFVEFILIISIVGILLSMAILTFQNRQQQTEEEQLKRDLMIVRKAIHAYFLDHDFFPRAKKNFRQAENMEYFKKQLLWYTNKKGEPSVTRNRDFRFGPYLSDFPKEAVTGLATVVIDTSSEDDLNRLKKMVAESANATGGWYYQAKNGFFIVNLNKNRFKEYYAFF